MPAIAALDECFAAITHISICADIGLEDQPLQHEALVAIQRRCDELDAIIQGIVLSLDACEHQALPPHSKARRMRRTC